MVQSRKYSIDQSCIIQSSVLHLETLEKFLGATPDILTRKPCDRFKNLCLNSFYVLEFKNCWTKALVSRAVCSYLRDIYKQTNKEGNILFLCI